MTNVLLGKGFWLRGVGKSCFAIGYAARFA